MGFIIVVTCILAVVAVIVGVLTILITEGKKLKEGCVGVLIALLLGLTSNTLTNSADTFKATSTAYTQSQVDLEDSKDALRNLKVYHEAVKLQRNSAELKNNDLSNKIKSLESDLRETQLEAALLKEQLKVEKARTKVDAQAVAALKVTNKHLQDKLDAINKAVGGK